MSTTWQAGAEGRRHDGNAVFHPALGAFIDGYDLLVMGATLILLRP